MTSDLRRSYAVACPRSAQEAFVDEGLGSMLPSN